MLPFPVRVAEQSHLIVWKRISVKAGAVVHDLVVLIPYRHAIRIEQQLPVVICNGGATFECRHSTIRKHYRGTAIKINARIISKVPNVGSPFEQRFFR